MDENEYLYWEILKKDLSLEDYTCFTCPNKDECPFAYDLYNRDGDCLVK